MKIIKLKKNNLNRAVQLAKEQLDKGNLVVIPSDTVYVLAVNATSSEAVKKIYRFKGRKFGKGISIFLPQVEQVRKYAVFNQDQEKLINTLLPGSFTVVLVSKHRTAPEIEPGDGTIGIRVIEHKFVSRLVKTTGYPITATSANISGKGPHYSVGSLLNTFSGEKKKQISLIIDMGQLARVPTSTVVRLVEEKIKIIRRGVLNPVLLKEEKTKFEQETKKLAQDFYFTYFAKHLKDRAVLVILQGELGVGKTVFAQGIGEIFNQQFTSPTFVLLDEHKINQAPVKNIYHVDLFRLEDEQEIKQLQLAKFFKKGNFILIEWGEKLSTFKRLKTKDVEFFFLQIRQENKARKFRLYQV